MSTHSQISDLLPAYALGILDPQEQIEVEAHLAECAVCREALRSHEEVTAALAFSVPPLIPPPSLKQHILASVTPDKAPAAAPPTPWWRRWLEGLKPSSIALAAASTALVFILLLGNIALFIRMQNLEQRLAALNRAGLQTLRLKGSDLAPQAWAILAMDKDAPSGLLVVDDLPPLDQSQAYQLWLITPEGERHSGGVFRVDEKGHGLLEINSPQLLQTYAAFGVTIEPATGSPCPTGPNVLKGENPSG